MPESDSEFEVFLSCIREGDFDQRLDEVYEAVTVRSNYLSANAKLGMTIGTRVMAKPDAKPEKLAYRIGTVIDMMPRSKDRVLVEWDARHCNGPNDRKWRMTAQSLVVHTGSALWR